MTELAKPFAMSLPAVSKHLKVLERAGLIARSREAQWRPCRIEPRALKDIDDWLEHYRRFFDESLDRLDDYLKKLQAKAQEPKQAEDNEIERWPQDSLDLERDPRSIIGIREFDAPRELVFSALTDPKHLAQWWGRTDSPRRPPASICGRAASGASSCTGPTAATIRTGSRSRRSCRPSASSTATAAATTSSRCSSGRPSFSKTSAARTRITWRGDFPSAAERDRVIKEYGADKGLCRRLRGLPNMWPAMAIRPPQQSARRAMQVQPYLAFEGRCEEAIEFYKKAVGAKVEMLMRFKDAQTNR